MKSILLILLGCAAAQASVITNVSAVAGTPYTVTYDTFAATEASMASRLSITADFGANGTFHCLWANASPNCSHANFSVSFTNNANTYPAINNGFWTITNHSTFVLASMTFNGVNGPGNGVAFDRCMSSRSVFNDSIAGFDCDSNGTVGSDQGWSASSRFGGTFGITAAAQYSNILKIAANPAVGDAYGVLRLTFGGNNSFTRNETFTFNADTDLVSNASTTPEPGSMALLGAGLLGLGAIARRRKA
jgi:PEP-CTERM motif